MTAQRGAIIKLAAVALHDLHDDEHLTDEARDIRRELVVAAKAEYDDMRRREVLPFSTVPPREPSPGEVDYYWIRYPNRPGRPEMVWIERRTRGLIVCYPRLGVVDDNAFSLEHCITHGAEFSGPIPRLA